MFFYTNSPISVCFNIQRQGIDYVFVVGDGACPVSFACPFCPLVWVIISMLYIVETGHASSLRGVDDYTNILIARPVSFIRFALSGIAETGHAPSLRG